MESIRGDPGRQLVAGNLSLDCEAHSVRVDGREVALTHQEFELLRRLAERRDEIIDRSELSLSMWGGAGPCEFKRLTVVISRMREKLAKSFPYKIETVRFRGYGLLCSSGPRTCRSEPNAKNL
jgi:DNA-binding response OmpR family regulator